MYWGMDSTGEGMLMVRDSSPGWATYFIVFICLGAFFALNLFDGVVIDNFNGET
jgi:hypothetical protein